MEPDTLRRMIATGPVTLAMTNGESHTLQSPETTIVSDFEVATLTKGPRGLYTTVLSIDNIVSATPVSESV